MLEGHQARDKVGSRLDERGMGALWPPGFTRAALHDDRFGHRLDALCAAPLTRLLRALALNALEGYAIPTPWLPQAPPLPSLGPRRMHRRGRGRRGRPPGLAKTGVRSANRGSFVWACVGMAGAPGAAGGVRATAALVWRRRWRWRRAGPWV